MHKSKEIFTYFYVIVFRFTLILDPLHVIFSRRLDNELFLEYGYQRIDKPIYCHFGDTQSKFRSHIGNNRRCYKFYSFNYSCLQSFSKICSNGILLMENIPSSRF